MEGRVDLGGWLDTETQVDLLGPTRLGLSRYEKQAHNRQAAG